ncbi:hypothetical protein BCR44DRAFT_81880 [Catenaria anguillulae PL171]|uniref:Uncharacterized protein n=1 Tax=Catenaria anguillulae PL171 TaxID=765915 RepID=A0A1Y2I2W1_9FUNG|nr:hypothetical protein BCR44DRAFT_81880 [Catenaria anguillulae PL171]
MYALADRWDRVGVERMVEALEATMWQSMRVLGRGSNGVHDDDTDQESDVSQDDQVDAFQDARAPQRAGGTPTRDSNMQTSEPGDAESGEEDAEYGDYIRASSPTDDDPALATPFSAFLGGGSHEDGKDGSEEADLEGLFAEFARMREIGAGATDKQRRVMAEQAAMSLWRAFGLSDEED